jgi:hypothetical protein
MISLLVVSQKAPLIICAYVKVRLIEMQYIIIIIIINCWMQRFDASQFRQLNPKPQSDVKFLSA